METLGARWVPHYFSSTRDSLLTAHVKRAASMAEVRWIRTWALTNYSTQLGLWYTWITSSFVHIELPHLLANLGALQLFGTVCSELPGMIALDMMAVALGASLSSSLACVAEKGTGPQNWAAFGASAIVSAFAAVAALGAPCKRMQYRAGPLDISVPVWAATTLLVVGDIVGLVQTRTPPSVRQALRYLTKGRPPQIGHTAHLAGAAFGAAYYILVLLPRARQATAVDIPAVATDKHAQLEWIADTHDADQRVNQPAMTPASSETGYDVLRDLDDFEAAE